MLRGFLSQSMLNDSGDERTYNQRGYKTKKSTKTIKKHPMVNFFMLGDFYAPDQYLNAN